MKCILLIREKQIAYILMTNGVEKIAEHLLPKRGRKGRVEGGKNIFCKIKLYLCFSLNIKCKVKRVIQKPKLSFDISKLWILLRFFVVSKNAFQIFLEFVKYGNFKRFLINTNSE